MSRNKDIIAIQADFRGTGLSSMDKGVIAPAELGLSNELSLELREWVEDYQFVIQLDHCERKENVQLIKELDTAGLLLMEKVRSELNDSFDIYYYSEGFLQRVLSTDHLKNLAEQMIDET